MLHTQATIHTTQTHAHQPHAAADHHRSFLIVAGPGRAQNAALTCASVLQQGGHRVDFFWTAQQAPRHLASHIRLGQYDVTVACGGDGTLGMVANAIMAAGEHRSAMAIIPAGTANDFARSVGLLDLSPRELATLMAHGTPQPIDLGQVNDRLFVNFASGGIGAEITTNTPKALKRALGGGAYLATGVVMSLTGGPRQVSLRGPGFQWSGPVIYLGIGNARLAGGGFAVSKRFALNDRLLDLTVIPDLSGAPLWDMLGKLVRHRAVPQNYATFKQLPWLEIDAPNGLQVNADGEPLTSDHFRFGLHGQQLPVFLPGTHRCDSRRSA